jgi:hypothetical protein
MKARTCAWIRRDGSGCPKAALKESAYSPPYCQPHEKMQLAIDAENQGRVSRGESPMTAGEIIAFVNAMTKAKRAAKRPKKAAAAGVS